MPKSRIRLYISITLLICLQQVLGVGSATSQVTLVCDTTGIAFTNFDNELVDADIDLIYSRTFLSTGYPYMTSSRINEFLEGLDLSQGDNEFHLGWRDYELIFNYFHGGNSTQYYGTFGSGNPRMRFFESDTTNVDERDHVDIYFVHKDDPGGGADNYPRWDPFGGGTPPDVKEDRLSGACDEFTLNAIELAPGFSGARNPTNPFVVDETPDPTWHLASKSSNVRANHETQHLLNGSRKGPGGPWPNETYSMAAEYLVGAHLRDGERPIYNTRYDWPLTNQDSDSVGLGYNHWYLWSAYLLQQFVVDSTNIEDDLYYKWIRRKSPSGVYKNDMSGLAGVLDDNNAYGSLGLGSNGDERLRNIFHNYSRAKWIDNPSPSLNAGRYGFGRGVDPYSYPGFFDNSFNPRERFTATEVPPKFIVRRSHSVAPCGPNGGVWCVVDSGLGFSGTTVRTTCDSIQVAIYSSDYIQLEADKYFEGSQQNTLHFALTWAPSLYPRLNAAVGSLARFRGHLKVSAIAYPLRSDSLYRFGSQVFSIYEGVIDTLQGRCDVTVPDFGGSAKSVVIVISLAQEYPSSSTSEIGYDLSGHRFGLTYRYSFDVQPGTEPPTTPIDLVAFKANPSANDSLEWLDANWCGSGGYYIQRAVGTQVDPVTIAETAADISTLSVMPPAGVKVAYYRVVRKNDALAVSNFATVGGKIQDSHTIAGDLYISGDVTIEPTDTLTVSPGTRIRMRPNFDSKAANFDLSKVEFLIEGTLRSLGSSTDSVVWESAAPVPTPGDWRGMRFLSYFPFDTTSTLQHTIVRHAVHGLHIQGSPKIERSRIQHNQFYGIWVQGLCNEDTVIVPEPRPRISYSVLEQNHGAEIASTFCAKPIIRHCNLRYSPALGGGLIDDGAVFTTFGAGYLRYNTIDGVGMGVYCVGLGASPFLVGQAVSPDSLKFGRNTIVSFRNYGVRSDDNASPELGSSNQNSYVAGRNNIFTTGYPSALFVSHSGSGTLNARYNYWGSAPPDPTKFVGSIDGLSANKYLSSFESEAGAGFLPAAALVGPDAAYDDAIGKEIAGDEEGAATDYRALVAKYPGEPIAPWALSRLLSMRLRSGRGRSELDYIDCMASAGPNQRLTEIARRVRPAFHLATGDVAAGLAAYDELLKSPEFDRGGLLFEIALQKGLALGDAAGAQAAILELQRCCPDEGRLKHARAMLHDIMDPGVWREGSNEVASDAGKESASPGVFELGQSSPNPTNPRATIAFEIPTEGRTILRIFNVRGQLVRTLLNSDLAPGRHVLEWDGQSGGGSAVASGVYYYRLDFGGKHLVRKMVVIK